MKDSPSVEHVKPLAFKERDLALFDFDGTITTCDTYRQFIDFAVPSLRLRLGGAALTPVILGHRWGLLPSWRVRSAVSWAAFFAANADRVADLGERFSEERVVHLLRPEAIERLAWHKERGDRIIVVSASLDAYLSPWCEEQGIELICTQLETKGRRLSGLYKKGDCSGEMKRRRILEKLSLSDYRSVYAYGDTEEDQEMLSLADHRYMNWVQLLH